MVVLPEYTLKQLMAQIVNATHGLQTTLGGQHITNTIAEPQLRMAALCAVQIATGETVWPGDRKIRIERRKQVDDIFQEC